MLKKSTKSTKSKKSTKSNFVKRKASGYDGARQSKNRLNRSYVTTYSVDEDNLVGVYEAERLRLEAKDLFRNGIGKACVDRFSTYVVGTGFNIQAKTSDKIWNTKSEKYFINWGKVADYNKRRTWNEILQTIIRDRLLVGESFFILTLNGQLQPIEAERICTPEPSSKFEGKKIVAGAEIVKGIIVAWYICDRDKYGVIDKRKYTRILAKDMVHIAATWRWDAVRSLAELAPILDTLRDKSEFTTSTIISAKIAARKSLIVMSDSDMPTTLPARTTDDSSSSSDIIQKRTKIIKTNDGEIYYGNPGDKLETLKQEVPATTYPEFTKSILGEVAAILGISYQVLMLELSKTDEVQLRVASQIFKIWQQWLTEKFIEKVWNWRIAKAVKAGDLPPAPLDDNGISEWYKIVILPPPDPFIKDETARDVAGFNLGSVSITQIAHRKSLDNRELLSEKTDDIGVAIELADDLNIKHPGQNITWRDVINSTGPASLSAVQTAADQDVLKEKDDKKEEEEEEEVEKVVPKKNIISKLFKRFT